MRAPTSIAISLGGICGAATRWGLVELLGADTPMAWGVIVANALGCLVLGALMGAFAPSSSIWFGALSLGFCGALTTFSSAAATIAEALDGDDLPSAAAHLAVEVAVAGSAFATGRWLARAAVADAPRPMPRTTSGATAAVVLAGAGLATLVAADGPGVVAAFAVAAALGTVIRVRLAHANRRVAWGTLTANIVASFVAGTVAVAPSTTVLVLGTAFAGSLSTVSTLVREVADGFAGPPQTARRDAVLYAVGTVTAGVAAAALGLTLG